MPDQNVIGAIDIGSNAIRMICARLTEDYRIEELEKNRTPIRLGEDVFRMGYITEERIEQLLATIKVYQKTLEQNNCKEICAYCTSAFRESGNRQTVIERVEMETGIQLESISGGEEAQLLQRAVQRVMDLSKGRIMLADLGGGSLEVTLLEEGEIEFAESFRMGTVRMLKMFPYHPEREKAFLNWAEYYVEDFIDFLKKRLGKPRVETLVITGGNATAIGRFSGKTDRDAPGFSQGRMILDKQRFSKFKRSVIKLNLNERIRDLEMEEDRADVILPALVIFEKLLKFTGCSGFVIPAVGLRDGILDEMRERQGNLPDWNTREQVIHSARYYAEKYLADMQHAETVRELSLQLFDELFELHELQSRDRLLLEVAALLHDIGRFIRPSDHAKHSMYLIRNMELVGVTNSELMMIALVARYHSGGMPSVKQKEFSRLDSEKRTTVTRLTALLRIGDALDREHRARAGNLSIEFDKDQVWLNLECLSGKSSDSMLALWALNHKKELFEKVFRRTLNADFGDGAGSSGN